METPFLMKFWNHVFLFLSPIFYDFVQENFSDGLVFYFLRHFQKMNQQSSIYSQERELHVLLHYKIFMYRITLCNIYINAGLTPTQYILIDISVICPTVSHLQIFIEHSLLGKSLFSASFPNHHPVLE